MESTVRTLSKMYGFDASEALKRLNENEKTRKKTNVKVPLPFYGEINENWCQGVRVNHGLYSQCTKAKQEGSEYCTACQKQLDSKQELTYGTIQERAAQCKNPLDYKDKKGKQVVPYGNVMKKLNISREKVEALAKDLGWEIPEEQFQVRVLKKGRPRKEKKDDAPKEKKARGRPRKQKKVVSASSESDDLISSLVEAAQKQPETDDETDGRKKLKVLVKKVGAKLTPAPAPAPEPTPVAAPEPTPVAAPEPTQVAAPAPTPVAAPEPTPVAAPKPTQVAAPASVATPVATPVVESNELDEDEEEFDVEEVTYGGVTYLEDDDKNLYDINTHEALDMKWDPEQECLV